VNSAYCVEICAATADCDAGLECASVGSSKVCLDRRDPAPAAPTKPTPQPSGDAGAPGDDDAVQFSHKSKASCAVTAPGIPSSSGLPALLALSLLFLRRRRG
jgi:MYXO-CTERM domain-containing protein